MSLPDITWLENIELKIESDSKCSCKWLENEKNVHYSGGSPDTRTLAQLRILYKAQARTIDELRDEIQTHQDEAARETRILNHKLTLLQGMYLNYKLTSLQSIPTTINSPYYKVCPQP